MNNNLTFLNKTLKCIYLRNDLKIKNKISKKKFSQLRRFFNHNINARRSYDIRHFGMDQSKCTSDLLHEHNIKEKDKKLEIKDNKNSLESFIKNMIHFHGPLTIAEYMKHCLTHPLYGYYMKKDVFGKKGDFITSPEISQMFGELIGIWCVALWEKMGRISKFRLVEIGPGRGSLIVDLLRASKSFKEFYNAIHLHLIDISSVMQDIQRKNLGAIQMNNNRKNKIEYKIPDGPSIEWHSSLSQVPQDLPIIIIAQEFFDALPVHQFQYTDKGWRECLVNMDNNNNLQFVLSPIVTPAVKAYIGNNKLYSNEKNNIGDRIEISPASAIEIQTIAKRIGKSIGVALIIDYGHDRQSINTLRGIRNHNFVSPLEQPGNTDLSVDVDFSLLKKASMTEDNIKVSNVITQEIFLKNMGIEYRLQHLLQNCEDEQTAQELVSSYKRIVEPDEMGSIFKTMAIVNKNLVKPSENIIGF